MDNKPNSIPARALLQEFTEERYNDFRASDPRGFKDECWARRHRVGKLKTNERAP